MVQRTLYKMDKKKANYQIGKWLNDTYRQITEKTNLNVITISIDM